MTAPRSRPPKGKRLPMAETPGKSRDARMAEVASLPVMSAASLLLEYAKGSFGELSLVETVAVLKDRVAAVQGGDLGDAEALLTAQAAALNAIFTELARRAALNFGTYLDAGERYLRLALRAQSQCTRTLETLAVMKNPQPVAFVRQANISHGHQQVVNHPPPGAGAASCAGETTTARTELLEAIPCERLDTGTTCSTSRADP